MHIRYAAFSNRLERLVRLHRGGISEVGGLKTLTHGDVSVFEVDDPNIGIKQVAHHQRGRDSAGASAGACNGSPAKLPAVRSK